MWVAGGTVKEHCCCRTRMWEMEPHSDLETLHSLLLSVVVTLRAQSQKGLPACLFIHNYISSILYRITDFLISSETNHSGRILSFQIKLFASKLTFIFLTSGHFYSVQIKIREEGSFSVCVIS